MTLVWFFDNTKRGSDPEKWRCNWHWERYSDRNQVALNNAIGEGRAKLEILKEKWNSMAPVDLQKLKQDDTDNVARYMKCLHPSGILYRGWDEEHPRDQRNSFDTLDLFLYWRELSSQLEEEFHDPSAIQPGDTWDDALARGVR